MTFAKCFSGELFPIETNGLKVNYKEWKQKMSQMGATCSLKVV